LEIPRKQPPIGAVRLTLNSEFTVEETVQLARYVWQEINGLSLRKHILPTPERADRIRYKSRDYSMQEVKLRKL
jgi:type I pantothenate kinase